MAFSSFGPFTAVESETADSRDRGVCKPGKNTLKSPPCDTIRERASHIVVGKSEVLSSKGIGGTFFPVFSPDLFHDLITSQMLSGI